MQRQTLELPLLSYVVMKVHKTRVDELVGEAARAVYKWPLLTNREGGGEGELNDNGLTSSALRENESKRTIPLNSIFTSGRPLPAAAGTHLRSSAALSESSADVPSQ